MFEKIPFPASKNNNTLIPKTAHFVNSRSKILNQCQMHGLKSAILAIFQKGLGWPCPVR